ncbi:MAG: FlxA-like family protein [Chitinophagaceae bacterium]|nr:FlxA-like family protein [Chitinophagaceae bacterium]
MRKPLPLLVLFLLSFAAQSQQMAMVDSFKRKLAAATTDQERVQYTGRIAMMLMSVNPQQADSFGKKAIEIAEFSRNRTLMVKAYRYNGLRFSYVAGKKENIQTSIGYYQKALKLAQESKLEDEQAYTLLGLSSVQCLIPDADKALNFATQAFSLVGNSGRDSLEAECFISFGDAYLVKDEKLLALKNYFNAVRIAEGTKKVKQKSSHLALLRRCYTKLRDYYFVIKDYDKSLDYAMQGKEILNQTNEGGEKFNLVNDLNFIAGLFSAKGEFELARSSYDEGLKIVDSLKFDAMRIPGYIGLLNLYLDSKKPVEALDFLRNNQQLLVYLKRMGFSSVIDQAYGVIYSEMGVLDSAGFHFQLARPAFEAVMGNAGKVGFFTQYSTYYLRAGKYPEAIDALRVAQQIAIETRNLEWQKRIAEKLDSASQLSGNYKEALQYAALSKSLEDSLEQLGKQEDLLQLQIADAQQREERLQAEKLEKKQQRDRYQYLAITIGIAIFFVALVMLGMFRVSANTIRIIGFFAFLMFFEFIFLLFKKNIYGLTEGEPWKDLAFMIALAAILVPLHHWLEHKVIHYLTSHNRLSISRGKAWVRGWFAKRES